MPHATPVPRPSGRQFTEVRRGIALAHLALQRDDSLAWWALLELTLGIGPKFIDYIYDQVEHGETFATALLRLHRLGLPGSTWGG